MIRYLGNFEEATVITNELAPFNVVCVVTVKGIIAPEKLGHALTIVQQRRPLLGARIVKNKKQFQFDSEGVGSIPVQIVNRQSGDQWQGVVEDELNKAFKIEVGPLVRCTYLFKPNSSAAAEIILTFHHAVIDGVSGTRLLHDLFTVLGGVKDLTITDTSQQLSLPPPAEQLFPPKYKGLRLHARLIPFMAGQMADEVKYRWWSRGIKRVPINSHGQCRILPLQLSPDDLHGLVRKSRREKVTLNSVLSASMLLTIHKYLHQDSSAPMRNIVFSDLRPYLRPLPSKNSTAPYISLSRFTTLMNSETDLWSLSRSLQKRIYETARRGDKFLSTVMSRGLMKMIIGKKSVRMGNTALSYGGSIHLEPSYGDIEITEIHAFISNNVLGPEFVAYASLHNGRLLWDFLFIDSDMDRETAKVIGQEVLDTLRSNM